MGIRLCCSVFSLIVLFGGGASVRSESIFLDRWDFIKQGIVGVYDIEGNFNPGRYKWSILTPSGAHIPGVSNYVDPNQIQPFPEATAHSEARRLSTPLIYRNCYDSDRCEFLFPQRERGPDQRLLIRLTGIHAPHVTASCEQEALLGKQAINLIHDHLSSAVHIELRNYSKRGEEFRGRLVADGQDRKRNA